MTTLYPRSSHALNLGETEQNLYRLPPLEGLLLHWHTHGMTAASCSEAQTLLARREQVLGPATLPGASIRLLCDIAMDCLFNLVVEESLSAWASRPLHARILRHGATLSAAAKQRLLPHRVLVQKTVTVRLGEHLLLCSGAGLQQLTPDHLRPVVQSLALPHKYARQWSINPPEVSPVERFGMQLGMVSPFLPPTRPAGLTALVLLPSPRVGEAQEREVALSLSLWESLLLPLRCLRPLVQAYAARAYPDVRCLVLEMESENSSHESDRSPSRSTSVVDSAASCGTLPL